MRSKLINEQGERTYALIFETGDEAADGLLKFAKENQLGGSHFTAIGAFYDVTLGYFDWETKEYEENRINEQVEVISLIGDIALKDGKPKVHAHVTVAKRDGTAHGGHLLKALVRPTLEVIITESPRKMQRKYDEASGLALIDPDAVD